MRRFPFQLQDVWEGQQQLVQARETIQGRAELHTVLLLVDSVQIRHGYSLARLVEQEQTKISTQTLLQTQADYASSTSGVFNLKRSTIYYSPKSVFNLRELQSILNLLKRVLHLCFAWENHN